MARVQALDPLLPQIGGMGEQVEIHDRARSSQRSRPALWVLVQVSLKGVASDPGWTALALAPELVLVLAPEGDTLQRRRGRAHTSGPGHSPAAEK